MSEHLVEIALAEGGLLALPIEDDSAPADGFTLYAAHRRERALGPAARWLPEALRQRLAAEAAPGDRKR